MQLPEKPSKVSVPRYVKVAIDAVRQSGHCNMLDVSCVTLTMIDVGLSEAAQWVREHKGEYAKGVFMGIRAEEEE
jgi:hypothetical protein